MRRAARAFGFDVIGRRTFMASFDDSQSSANRPEPHRDGQRRARRHVFPERFFLDQLAIECLFCCAEGGNRTQFLEHGSARNHDESRR